MINPTDSTDSIRQNTLLIDIATHNVICLAPTDSVGKAARLMAEKRISSIVIADGSGHPVGIVTERDMLHAMQSGCPTATMLREVMSAPVITVPGATTCLDAHQVFLHDGIRHLVIVDADQRLLGVVSETDFRLHINLTALTGRRQVATIMSRSVFSMPPEARLHDALNAMQSHRDTCVVVVESGRPVGIVTERDIVRLYSSHPEWIDIPVRDVMASPVLSIPLDSSINQAAERMLTAKVRHLVVVDDAGLIAGLIGEHDLTHSMAVSLIDARQLVRSTFLDTLIDTLPDLVWLKDAEGVYLACNPRFESFFGAKENEIIGKTDYDFVDKELADFFRAHDCKAMEKDGPSVNEEWVTFAADGHRELLETVKMPMRDSQAKLIGVLGIARDITERKRAETANLRQNRELRAISSCNQTLMRAEDEQTLLDDICHIVCDEAGYRMVWVGYAENDAAKTIRPVVWAGTDDGFIAQTGLTWADTEPGGEFCATAIRNGKSACIQDFAALPPTTPGRDNALQRGYLSGIALPLKDDSGNVFGVLNIYSAKTNAFTPNEVRLLNELAGDLAFGIRVLRSRIERNRAEQERLAHLRFVESMDRVNRAIQGTNDLEQMLRDVLEAVLAIFDCDRVWLFHPCDPDSPSFRVPMEIAKPEYPGAGILNVDVPLPADMARNLGEALESADPVTYAVGTERPINKVSADQFGVKSMMMVAVYPKSGKPWAFGMHQCAFARMWTPDEQRLFQEINRRLADGLTSLLSHRDLRESEAKYRRIVDTAQEGIWVLGPDTLTTFVNARMAEMLGCSGAEMIGRPVTDFMFEEDAADHLKKMENRRQEMSEHYERRYRRKDGQTVWTLASATPIFDDAHRFAGSFGMFTDITDRKLAEAGVLSLNQELEQRIADRTAQLESANKELEAFSYSVSHDLRAPLRHIDGFLGLLKERTAATLDEESLRYVNTISMAARHMDALIDDLLSFSRMGRADMAQTRVDLGALVQEVVRELEPETQDRIIRWHIADLPVVTGDRAMLHVVLVNLISNALKFTQRRPQTEIEIGYLPDQATDTVVFVRDNGAGFDMKYADKLFGVFQRLHRAEEFEGTGIGLANVHRIIDRHGGRTWAEGKIDGGATFFFSLPQSQEGNPAGNVASHVSTG